MPETSKYILNSGKHHTPSGGVILPGGVVELSAAQARVYADKITPIAVHQAQAAVAQASEAVEEEEEEEEVSKSKGTKGSK